MSQSDLFGIDITIQRVPVKIGDAFEERALTCLSSRMKQGLITQIQQAIRALAALKKTGNKVDSLKFKAFVERILLKQYSTTYQLDRTRQWLKLQKLQQRVRMHGCCQLPREAEVTNLQLLRRQGDYYLHVVTYQARTAQPCLTSPPVTAIGIDTGLQTQFTFSNGMAVEYRVSFSEHLRWLYRAFSRTHLGSRNRHKLWVKLQKIFATLNNRKKEIRNQLASYLVRHYATFVIKMNSYAPGSACTAIKWPISPSERFCGFSPNEVALYRKTRLFFRPLSDVRAGVPIETRTS